MEGFLLRARGAAPLLVGASPPAPRSFRIAGQSVRVGGEESARLRSHFTGKAAARTPSSGPLRALPTGPTAATSRKPAADPIARMQPRIPGAAGGPVSRPLPAAPNRV